MENEGTCDIVPLRSAKSPENSSDIPSGEVLVLTCYYTNASTEQTQAGSTKRCRNAQTLCGSHNTRPFFSNLQRQGVSLITFYSQWDEELAVNGECIRYLEETVITIWTLFLYYTTLKKTHVYMSYVLQVVCASSRTDRDVSDNKPQVSPLAWKRHPIKTWP